MKFTNKSRRTSVAILTLISLGLLFVSAPASDSKRKDTTRLPFEPTEELVYDGEFTRALFRGINIAELRFVANRTQTPSNQTRATSPAALHFTLEAQTKGLLRKLFGLNFRQRVESTVELETFSVLQTTKLDQQGKRLRTSEAVFDRDAGKVVWTERDPNDPNREPRVVTSQMNGTVQDIASAFYYLRTQNLTVGKSLEILVSDSGQVYRVPVVVSEKKKLKSVIGEVQTLKVEPEIFGEGRLVRGKGKLSIWFTDDARHIPVRARINNEMGTIDIKLKRMSGTPQKPLN